MFDSVEIGLSELNPILADSERLKKIHWLVFNAAANLDEAKSILGVSDEEYNMLMNVAAND